MTEGKKEFTKPTLLSSCLSKGCSGELSCVLGNIVCQSLIKYSGPHFQWLVSCSKCTTQWHACHFLCGTLCKISENSRQSSGIWNHEIGRMICKKEGGYIKCSPCKSNPDYDTIRSSFDDIALKLEDELPPEPEDNPPILPPLKDELPPLPNFPPLKLEDELPPLVLNSVRYTKNKRKRVNFTEEEDRDLFAYKNLGNTNSHIAIYMTKKYRRSIESRDIKRRFHLLQKHCDKVEKMESLKNAEFAKKIIEIVDGGDYAYFPLSYK